MRRRLPQIPPYHERVAAAARWQTALAILSLDAALPLWQPMGLSLTPEQTAHVNATAKAAYADWLQGQWNPFDVDYDRAPTIVESFVDTVERENGAEARARLEGWAQRTFDLGDNRGQMELSGSLMRLWHQARAGDPKLGLPTDILGIVLPAIRGLREPSYVVPTREDVRSDWDRQVLTGYPGDFDCTDSISLLLRQSAMQEMLAQLRNKLPPQQYDVLMAWCASHPY
jgi:hypothetical protein